MVGDGYRLGESELKRGLWAWRGQEMSPRKQDTVALLGERVRRKDRQGRGPGMLVSGLPHTRLGRGGGMLDTEPPLPSRGTC